MKAFDSEIKALTGSIKHHLGHTYLSDKNRAARESELRAAYQKVSKFPTQEITGHVWDEMNNLAEQAMINS